MSDDQNKWLTANQVFGNLRPGNPQASYNAQLEEVVPCWIKALNTRDNPCWKPYTTLRKKAPAIVARWLPDWREPRVVRGAAAYVLGHFAPGEPKAAVPALCKVATSDPNPNVRAIALEAVSNIGVDSAEALPLMLKTLLDCTNRDQRVFAAVWFKSATPAPEKAVPALIAALVKYPELCDHCARALAAYGPRAAFAVEQLTILAKTNHVNVAWGAFDAVAHIDPEAAMSTGARWSTSSVYQTTWNPRYGEYCRTNPGHSGRRE